MFGVYEVDGPDEPVETHATGMEAAEAARVLNVAQAEAGSDTRFKVRPIVDDSWKERERRRLVYGEYTRLPGEVDVMCQASQPLHYAHASKSKPGFIAYTESPEKGSQDRQTRKRAGAYLQQYFADLGAPEVQRLALICDNEAAPRVLQFASTADEIEEVYTTGPTSCMSYSPDNYESSEHPVRAYAGPDLEVGYIEANDKITGRVVLWPAEMKHTVIYGDIERMQQALTDAGYSSGSLEGARMRKLEDSARCGVYVLPYIDDAYAVTDAGDDMWAICEGGEQRADRTDGLSGGVDCSNCGETLDPDDATHIDGDTFCPDCSFYCEFCDEAAAEGHYIEDYGGTVCETCRDDNFTCCDGCYEYIRDETIIDHSNGSHCEDCFMEDYTFCSVCDDSVAHDALVQDDDGEAYCEDCAPEEVAEDF